MWKGHLLYHVFDEDEIAELHPLLVPVARRSQRQDDGVCDLDHGLQRGGEDDEEDDAEKEGALQGLHVQQPRLERQQEQGHALCHPSGGKKKKINQSGKE